MGGPQAEDPAVARARSPGSGAPPASGWAPLVPELLVNDLAASLAFWCGRLGFRIAYDRPAAGFAYLEREGAQVMLCQRNGSWETGDMRRPLGQGINLQIRVASVAPILAALDTAGWPLFEAPQEAWYRVGDHEGGQREFLVQDPDGYLVRLAEDLGRRPAPASGTRL